MPHLRFLGRLWRVSTDELFVPSSCAAISRIIWTVFLSVVISSIADDLRSCKSGEVVIAYLSLSVVTSVLSIICEIYLSHMSLKGTVGQPEKREGIAKQLSAHVGLIILQFGCAIFGFCLITQPSLPCHDDVSGVVEISLLYIVVISQILDVSGVLCCCYLLSSKRYNPEEYDGELPHQVYDRPSQLAEDIELYENRCKSLCRSLQLCTCNLFGGSSIQEDLEAVAKIFSNYFHHEGFLDMVPSDLVVGIVLLHGQQRQRRYELRAMALKQMKKAGSAPSFNPILSHSSSDASLNASVTADSEFSDNLNLQGAPVRRLPLLVSAKKRELMSEKPVPTSSGEVAGLIDYDDLCEAAHYSHFALSAYSTLIYLYMYPCTGICRLASFRSCGKMETTECFHPSSSTCCGNYLCCCSCCRPKSCDYSNDNTPLSKKYDRIISDQFCGLHQAAVIKMGRYKNARLLYADFSNDTFKKPYAIFWDFEKQCVVISIRGTLSLEDCITDALADPTSMEEAGEKWGFDGKNRFAHGGMLRAAMYIRNELESNPCIVGILNEYHHRNGNGSTTNTMFRSNSPTDLEAPLNNPQLIVVGHSLGAGTAVLLAILLKHKYPGLKCFGYGTPGSVLDERTCHECSDYITSVILNNDLVARLSVRALCKIREEVLVNIQRCKVNKFTLMQHAIFKENEDVEKFMHPSDAIPDSPFNRMIARYLDIMKVKSTHTLMRQLLFLPGRILHIREVGTARGFLFGKKRLYCAFQSDLKLFDDIVISSRMVLDHLPDQYVNELELLVKEHHSELKRGTTQ